MGGKKVISKERLVSIFLENNCLVDEELLDFIIRGDIVSATSIMQKDPELIYILDKILNYIKENKNNNYSQNNSLPETNDQNLIYNPNNSNNTILIQPTNSSINQPINTTPKTETTLLDYEDIETKPIKIIFSYNEPSQKRTTAHYIHYFTNRYKSLEKMLRTRLELHNTLSIIRIQEKKDNEPIVCIGMIYDKQITKNKNILLTLEDPSGFLKCVIKSTNKELYKLANEICLDEIIGLTGKKSGELIYVDNLLWPDVPLIKELKKSPDESYAIFMSDTEFGSKMFLEEPFMKFISWINGELGSSEQKEVVKKIKYIFLAGDLVNGIGIYPTQEKDLAINDIYKQYDEMAKYLKMIPQRISLVISPGNHDAMRVSEPQPTLSKEFAKSVLELPNVIPLSNPSWINFHSSKFFPGFDVLLYHGFSFIYYANTIESIRQAGGQERADLIMKYLLKRRHLAPTHASNLYLPDPKSDPLIIDRVPDFFVSGHLHQVIVANYRNITLINCSAWVSKTDFQEKMGIEPKPGRIILVNLQTRESKIINFNKDEQ